MCIRDSSDVADGAWYADAAKVCYEVGLITGTDAGFAPDKILTVGEVAAIAARMNEAITGEAIPMATPKPGETLPWYFSYVTYLEKLGIDVPDPEKQATRLELLTLMGGVIPENMLSPINSITTLPDTDAVSYSHLQGHWAQEVVEKAEAYGLVEGKPDGTFGVGEDVYKRQPPAAGPGTWPRAGRCSGSPHGPPSSR